MSRPYLKNDLFHFTIQREAQKSRENALKQKNQEQIKKQQAQLNRASKNVNKKPFDTSSAFKVQVKQVAQKFKIDDEFKEIFSEFKKKKQSNVDEDKSNSKLKNSHNVFFTPKNTIKISMPKVDLTKQQKKSKYQIERQIEKQTKKLRIQNWKMGKQLRKNFKFQEKQKEQKDQQQKQKEQEQDKSQIKPNNKIQQQQSLSSENQQSICEGKQTKLKKQKKQKKKVETKKASNKKQKKIKKQSNYVKIDLKRKFKDRFVGALGRNIRNLSFKNAWKERMKRIDKELQKDEQQMHNTYVNSLSQAMFITINLDEQQEVKDDLHYEIPTSYDRESLEKLIFDLFGFQGFREGQYETIKNILDAKSTLFVSETASGKSLTYIISSVISKGLSIVISPLISLMLDQLKHLPSDLPAACLSSLLNPQQKYQILEMVKKGNIQLLFLTPESFLTDIMYHVKQFPPINFVCIDEAHSMSELSHSFRPSYLSLQQIILKHFNYQKQKPVVLCLTATANVETIDSICEKMKIQETICSKTVINKNLFVTISREESSENKFKGLLTYLTTRPIQRCNGILIYCRTIHIMETVFNYLNNSGIQLCRKFHSSLQNKEKIQIMDKFRDGKIKIVIATVALGMGLDFQNLDCVIHFNMPKSVENYIQEIGRAGRRNKRAYCHLFLDKVDYYVERNYFLADQLEYPNFIEIIEEMKKKSHCESKRKTTITKHNSKEVQNVNNLKRLSLNENINDQEIFFSDEDQQFQEDKEENESDNKLPQIYPNICQTFKPLSYIKASQLADKGKIKQQAVLNLLLKIQNNLSKQTFKVFPLSHETIKLTFLKENKQEIIAQSPIFKKIIQNCKVIKGVHYIRMISKCNSLKMTPIQLLSYLHELKNKYWMKIQTINEIFIWQLQSDVSTTYDKLNDDLNKKKILQEFNKVQRVALTKFNIFYSICFSKSVNMVETLIRNKFILNHEDPLPRTSIMDYFDLYFKKDTQQIYNILRKQSNPDDSDAVLTTQCAYLPLEEVDLKIRQQIRRSVHLFIQHIQSISIDRPFVDNIKPYRNGRKIARVFLGINDKEQNWKIYQQHEYWGKFKNIDYEELLKAVKDSIKDFIENDGRKYLPEFKSSKISYKKQSVNINEETKKQKTSQKQLQEEQQL